MKKLLFKGTPYHTDTYIVEGYVFKKGEITEVKDEDVEKILKLEAPGVFEIKKEEKKKEEKKTKTEAKEAIDYSNKEITPETYKKK